MHLIIYLEIIRIISHFAVCISINYRMIDVLEFLSLSVLEHKTGQTIGCFLNGK